MKKLFQYPLILASNSPRRQSLLKDAGFNFTITVPNIDETFPDSMPPESVPCYLAQKKATALLSTENNNIILAADTIVVLNNTVLNKPKNRQEAINMLMCLSGKTHVVITGVCIIYKDKTILFDDCTEVSFVSLSPPEIEYYIDHYQPFDKAGSYGVQDWIGMVGIKKINGSFFTVMGLPIHKVYEELKRISYPH